MSLAIGQPRRIIGLAARLRASAAARRIAANTSWLLGDRLVRLVLAFVVGAWVARATGDLIGYLNADDFFCRIDAAQLIATAATANPGAAAISGSVAIVAARDPSKLRRAYPASPFAQCMLRFGHMPPHPGSYTRAAAFDRIGGFDPTIRTGADFEWMLRFFIRERLAAVPIPETLVTLRDGGITNDGFGSRRRINAEALASLRRAGIASSAPLIWSKYLAKAAQLVVRPRGWPAPLPVRWTP
ncbi:hypothetical protein KX816_19855 [Sphingosinicellaceae bacterium]|nr:hypothetical protein KX816_19855 [Sphingosinicellaceae bacterium]